MALTTSYISSDRLIDVNALVGSGSTSRIWRYPDRPGVVVKSPIESWLKSSTSRAKSLQHKFHNEIEILKILGDHRRINRYLGSLDPDQPFHDILLQEAVNGDVQRYLQKHNSSISIKQRLQWCCQAAEGLSYCHEMGILHCDLRPDNLLLDEDFSLRFCDFAGSVCGEFNGGGLPDYGFFDPRDEDIFTVTEIMEVFGLGSIMYTIMTGHRPHGPCIFSTSQEQTEYEATFEVYIRNGKFPDTTKLVCGDIIQDCWSKKLPSAKAVLLSLEALSFTPSTPAIQDTVVGEDIQ